MSRVIGREHIYEVLKLISPDRQPDFDEKLAARVGRDVGAKFIVGGGYQRVGEMLRITARAVEVESGEIIKTVKIDGPMNDIFGLQDKIVYELSKDIDIKLKTAEREVIEERETSVVEAFEAYTKGMMNLRQASRDGLDRAISLFEKATTLDAHYARAHASLGYALELKGQFLSIPELTERAIGSFQRAIALEPMIPESYSGLGLAFSQLGQDDEAIGAIRRALTFAPDQFEARAALGRVYFIGKGMFREAAVEYERALAVNDKAGWVALQMAQCYAYLGDYAKAEQAARKAIVLQEKYNSGREGMQIVGSYGRLGYIYYLQGRYDDAISEYYRELVALRQADHALKDRVKIEINQKLASAYARQGKMDDAREAFSQVVDGFEKRLEVGADDSFTRYYVALAYAAMGDDEHALESLEKAASGRRRFTVERAKREPDFEFLRGDERFQALIRG